MYYEIPLVFLDDDVSVCGQAFYEAVPRIVLDNSLPDSILGLPVRVVLHPVWNGLGDVVLERINSNIGKPEFQAGTLTEKHRFKVALRWCMSGEARGVCFCDFGYPSSVTIDNEDVDCLTEIARMLHSIHLDEGGPCEDVLSYFQEERQGLLLAAALATNEAADVDIVIVSGKSPLSVKEISALRKMLAGRKSVYTSSKILNKSPVYKAISLVKEAVKKFADIRVQPVSSKFWPEGTDRWFGSGASDFPPHNFPNRIDQPSEYLRYLGIVRPYLIAMGAQEDLANAWLSDHLFYETLKRFVGCYAQAGHGPRSLVLGCLVFPLLAAVGSKNWMQELDFSKGKEPVFSAASPEVVRAFVCLSFKLFEALARQKPSYPSMDVKAGFAYDKVLGASFLIKFRINCERGETGKLSLLSKISNIDSTQVVGDVAEAFRDIVKFVENSPCQYKPVLTLAPCAADDPVDIEAWTQLIIRVPHE